MGFNDEYLEIDAPQLVCARCDRTAGPLDWRCEACGGPLEIANLPAFSADQLGPARGLWRYARMLPARRTISLGEGDTPLERVELGGIAFWAKLEYFAPTASYKDRGTTIFINHLLAHGVGVVAEDSSGNAGASLAAYAAAARMQARVYVPAHASDSKQRQIACFGAELRTVPGPRSAATAACEQAVTSEGLVYASHAWSPFYIAGHMTCGWEIWEQLGRRAPDAIICPVGQGNLFLGIARGFAALQAAGLIERMPRLYAVQADACAPIASAWEAASPEPHPADEQPTIAEGIRITAPIRGREVLEVVRSSGGAVLRVDEAAIRAAQQDMQQRGLLIEPTSAVAVAALATIHATLDPQATIVIPLTGSGLKVLAG